MLCSDTNSHCSTINNPMNHILLDKAMRLTLDVSIPLKLNEWFSVTDVFMAGVTIFELVVSTPVPLFFIEFILFVATKLGTDNLWERLLMSRCNSFSCSSNISRRDLLP